MGTFVLYARPHQPASERVLLYLQDHELTAWVSVRELSQPAHQAALRALGGEEGPALWDGERLTVGAEAVIARLQAYADVGRSG